MARRPSKKAQTVFQNTYFDALWVVSNLGVEYAIKNNVTVTLGMKGTDGHKCERTLDDVLRITTMKQRHAITDYKLGLITEDETKKRYQALNIVVNTVIYERNKLGC